MKCIARLIRNHSTSCIARKELREKCGRSSWLKRCFWPKVKSPKIWLSCWISGAIRDLMCTVGRGYCPGSVSLWPPARRAYASERESGMLHYPRLFLTGTYDLSSGNRPGGVSIKNWFIKILLAGCRFSVVAEECGRTIYWDSAWRGTQP